VATITYTEIVLAAAALATCGTAGAPSRSVPALQPAAIAAAIATTIRTRPRRRAFHNLMLRSYASCMKEI